MGLEPVSWGPHVWAAIHIICLGAPDMFQGSDQLSYHKFLDSLPYILPCEKCREHLKSHMERYPIDGALSGGKTTLFKWSVNLHNAVNRSLGKKEMSVEDAMQHWTAVLNGTNVDKKEGYKLRTSCSTQHQQFKFAVFVMMLIIIGMIIGLLLSTYLRT